MEKIVTSPGICAPATAPEAPAQVLAASLPVELPRAERRRALLYQVFLYLPLALQLVVAKSAYVLLSGVHSTPALWPLAFLEDIASVALLVFASYGLYLLSPKPLRLPLLGSLHVLSFGFMVIVGLDLGFFLITGSLQGWVTFRHALGDVTSYSVIIGNVFSKPLVWLAMPIPFLFVAFPTWALRHPRLQAWIHKPQALVPSPGLSTPRKAFLLLLLTGFSFHCAHAFLPQEQRRSILAYAFVDMAYKRPTLSPAMRQKVAQQKPIFQTSKMSLTPASRTQKKKPNIVLIMLESVGANSVTPYVPTLATTPFLDRLSRRSWLVEDMYIFIPQTSKSMVSILCSIFPRISMTLKEGEPDGLKSRCLPHLLGTAGYRTSYFASGVIDFEGMDNFLNNAGFQDVFGSPQLPKKGFEKTNYFGYEEGLMLKPSLAWIDRQRKAKKPFFITYLTLTSHHPYTTPSHYKPRRLSDHAQKNAYFNAIRYTDQFLQRLFAAFRKRGMDKDTIFVLIGDHGESFGEHQRYQHPGVIWNEATRVPMLLYAPHLLKGSKRLKGPRQNVDIPPTLLSMLKMKTQGGHFAGRSLLKPPDPSRKIFMSCWYEQACMAMVHKHMKYIYHFGTRPFEIFDLSQDPGERENLLWQRKDGPQIAKTITQKMLLQQARINYQHGE